MKEIERKFLVDDRNFPIELNEDNKIIIKQFYTLVEERKEIRYRHVKKDKDKYYKEIKTGKGLEREEKREEINSNTYQNKLLNSKSTPITKVRYLFDYNGYEGELDIFTFPVLRYNLLEFEFDTKNEANNFKPPEWVIKEVTEDEYYKNKNIWKRLNGK